MQCPCCSGKAYNDCCEFYHLGKQALTPETLMRARYSAYTLANIDFIAATMRGKAAQGFNALDAGKWAKQVSWLKLIVFDTSVIKNDRGTVTFLAQYSLNEENNFLLEKSFFKKINGEWYYIDGTLPSIGRNDRCPCGCGKKFKQHLGEKF